MVNKNQKEKPTMLYWSWDHQKCSFWPHSDGAGGQSKLDEDPRTINFLRTIKRRHL